MDFQPLIMWARIDFCKQKICYRCHFQNKWKSLFPWLPDIFQVKQFWVMILLHRFLGDEKRNNEKPYLQNFINNIFSGCYFNNNFFLSLNFHFLPLSPCGHSYLWYHSKHILRIDQLIPHDHLWWTTNDGGLHCRLLIGQRWDGDDTRGLDLKLIIGLTEWIIKRTIVSTRLSSSETGIRPKAIILFLNIVDSWAIWSWDWKSGNQ